MALIQTNGMLLPRERVWQVVRSYKAGEVFSALQVQDKCSPMVPYDTAKVYLKDLAKAGFLQAIRQKLPASAGNKAAPTTYKVVKTTFEAPRVGRFGTAMQGIGVLAMWRMMKVLKTFDSADLAIAASQGDCRVSISTARNYITLLSKAGYLKTERAPAPFFPGRYRLVRDTGHHAPAITRVKCVFDRNLGQYTWQQSAQEVCDGLE